jgi:hypothetical protein
MNIYCPTDKNHKYWSDNVFCTTCGTKLIKKSLVCQECNRKQFPVNGETDSDIVYCAFCGSNNLKSVEGE